MRVVLATLALAAVLAGCGEGGVPSGEPSGSTGGATPPESTTTGSSGPIRIELVSAAGTQRATPGATCVDGQNEAACGDIAPPIPERMSAVAPGETVKIVLVNGIVQRPKHCVAGRETGCVGEITVSMLGCPIQQRYRIPIDEGSSATEWQVSIPSGSWQLNVFANFQGDDGSTGNISGALGLLVDPGAKQEVLPAGTPPIVC
ncbi:MAG TPA: hypothetical protein VH306_06910 [Gaiellaceae bacterium]